MESRDELPTPLPPWVPPEDEEEEILSEIMFVSSSASVGESVGQYDLRIGLSPVNTSAIILNYQLGGTATKGEDYSIGNTGSIAVSAGSDFVNIPIVILDDQETEDDETVVFTLVERKDYQLGNTMRHILTIVDNDEEEEKILPEIMFVSSSASVGESVGQYDLRIGLNIINDNPISLNYKLEGTATKGLDYNVSSAGNILIPAQSFFAGIPIVVSDDQEDEKDETIIITITDASGAVVGMSNRHVLTIIDNDEPDMPPSDNPKIGSKVAFVQESSNADESIGTKEVRIILPGFDATGDDSPTYSVNYTIEGSTAGGEDFEIENLGNISVKDDAQSAIIPIKIVDDIHDEEDEMIFLTLTEIGGGHKCTMVCTHTLTIEDNDMPIMPKEPEASFSEESSSVDENSLGGLPPIILQVHNQSTRVVIDYSVTGTATEGEDYTIRGIEEGMGTKTISPGLGPQYTYINIKLIDDSLVEEDETIVLTITGVDGANLGTPSSHIITIIDDDEIEPPIVITPPVVPVIPIKVGFVVDSVSVHEAFGQDFGAYHLTADISPVSDEDFTIGYSLSGTAMEDMDYRIENSGGVEVTAGSSIVYIQIAISDDTEVETEETVIVTLMESNNYELGWISEHVLTIRDNDQIRTSVGSEIPLEFSLKQNYPNPFNPSTQIGFSITKTQKVTLKVYDLLGEEVQTLLDGIEHAGRHSVPFNGVGLASGTYVYVLMTEEQKAVKMMTLIK